MRHGSGSVNESISLKCIITFNCYFVFNPISRGEGCKQHPLTSDADFTLILWTEVTIFVTKIQVLQCRKPP